MILRDVCVNANYFILYLKEKLYLFSPMNEQVKKTKTINNGNHFEMEIFFALYVIRKKKIMLRVNIELLMLLLFKTKN